LARALLGEGIGMEVFVSVEDDGGYLPTQGGFLLI
jgi:hypothetical protein